MLLHCCFATLSLQTLGLSQHTLQGLSFPYWSYTALNEIRCSDSLPNVTFLYLLMAQFPAGKCKFFSFCQVLLFSMKLKEVYGSGGKAAVWWSPISMILPSGNQNSSIDKAAISSPLTNDGGSCSPPGEHQETPEKEHCMWRKSKYSCTSVSIVVSSSTQWAINWHSLSPGINLHIFKWIWQVLTLKIAPRHLYLCKHTHLC